MARLALRCFLFDYSRSFDNVSDRYTLKWVEDDGRQWAQIVLVLSLPRGELEHHGGLPNATLYLPGLPQLVEAGLVVELT